MNIRTTMLATSAAMILATPLAQAHVSFVDNTAEAGRSFIATANISHGCEDVSGHYDTYKVEIELPDGVTARPVHSSIGAASVDDAENPTLLTWQKDPADAEGHDSHFYQVEFRFSVPNTPLASLEFRTTQYCSDGAIEAGLPLIWEGADVPVILVVPVHAPGWNKYTAQADIDAGTIAAFFADAEIVWANNQAYSSNPVIAGLINNPLTVIPAGTDYWVKY